METEEKLISDLIKIGFVDLGLSVQWAMCNVGAHNPKDNGNYYDFDELGRRKLKSCNLLAVKVL
ncbi:MAG: hypothetical protein MJ197_09225 [Bacteroidales bacterium]|nr:hypothetical protein [Bacteroidales bacterium]